MAKSGALLAILLLVTMVSSTFSVGDAFQFKVGDAEGWHLPDDNNREMYETWAGNIDFHVKDSILFVYKNDSVIKVSKPGYYHCNETSTTGVIIPKDGSTLFTLDKPGFYFFVSGNQEHCIRGQRVMIEVPDPNSAHSKSDAAKSMSTVGLGVMLMHLLVIVLVF